MRTQDKSLCKGAIHTVQATVDPSHFDSVASQFQNPFAVNSGEWNQSDQPILIEDEIHVWRASLELDPKVLLKLEAVLTPEEKSRADRYVFARDHGHFVAARGILRELLGAYLRISPSEIEFDYGPHGKPALRTEYMKQQHVHFNLSHSHGIAVYAFSLGREVGIDLEPIRPEFSGDEIARRYFSPKELAELRGLPPELRAEGFFLCWTRKEAYVKARGEGLQIPLASFNVSLIPGHAPQLESVDSTRWSLQSFEPAPRYAAAIVGEGQGWRLRCESWRPL